MYAKKLHLHSMIVHAVIAFGPLAAIALIFKEQGVTLGAGADVSAQAWNILEKLSIVMMFLIGLLSLVTGIGDRNKVYGKWQSTHIIKLWCTLLLMGALAIEILYWFCPTEGATGLFSLYGALVVVANNLLILVLSAAGLKITLGRQSLEGTSYVPDLFNKQARRDILDEVRAYIHEEPKIVDFE